MNIVSRLTAKNQTTIPKVIVQALRLKPSSLLVFELLEDGRVLLTSKSTTFEELAGRFPKRKRRKYYSGAEMQAAISDGAVIRFKKMNRVS
jgi:bifunctional DNA-binding transcriptional regulator/antitoxin component of YhaV-PrlF toxin-antitoxin module